MLRLAPIVLLLSATPLSAALPPPVRAMIDAAIATGDPAKVAAVVEAAKATNADDAVEIDALHTAFRDDQQRLAADKERQKLAAIRSAGMLERWSGQGELGGFRSTGNTDTTGLTGAISLERKGIAWSHKLIARADYQRSGGQTTREKYFAAYEPRVDVGDDLFVYGLAQYDQDRFQGYAHRYAVSGGIGAKLIRTKAIDLSIKAGPALRLTQTTDGLSDTRLAGLFGLDFDWRLTERLKLTQGANAYTETGGAAVALVDSRSTTVNLITGLEARLSDRLSTRLSYAVDYDSNPPIGKTGTDTTTRFGIVYGF